jgi:chlorobactene glucosyltransferase
VPDLLDFILSPLGQQVGVLAYLMVILGNTLLNGRGLPRLGTIPAPGHWPAVAVLVPARNEARTICRCLTSLLQQDYPDFEVWIIDDDSQDNTLPILNGLAASNPCLHVLRSDPLPTGWLGKNWACWQLVQHVPERFPRLLFVDVDTWYAPDALRQAVAMMEAGQYDLLSILPRQMTESLAEQLTVPILSWSLLSHFPLWLTRRMRWPGLAAAVGQFMLWRREAYQAVGGHAAVRGEIIEDIALARRAARMGLRAALLPGPDHVFCRMYRTTGEVLQGFGKNLYAVFGRRWFSYLFVWLWLGLVFLSPWLFLLGKVMFSWPTSIPLALASIGLAGLIWLLVVRQSRISSRSIFLPFIL